MAQTNKIKIVIVGDLGIFYSALVMLLENEKKLEITGKVPKISHISNLAAANKPDVILVVLPENETGSKLFLSIANSPLDIPILVLTDNDDIKIHDKCLKSGVNGVILKNNSAEMLVKAIQKVHQGEFWFERSLLGNTVKQMINERQKFRKDYSDTAFDKFTERERQVIDLICQGLKNREIADKLFIAETTVRHHLSAVFEKLHVTSRLELVVYAFENGLVPKKTRVEKS